MPAKFALLALGLILWRPLPAEMADIPTAELSGPPSPARIGSLVDTAAVSGWGALVPGMRRAAFSAYEAHSDYARPWFDLYRWSDLLGTPYNRALQTWIKAVEQAKVAHPNMAGNYGFQAGSLAAQLSRELQLVVLGDAAFSGKFFALLTPVDNPAQVLAILQRLYRQNPAWFLEYQNLALAISVVYDVPPPPNWPHGQVGPNALPRQWPAPEDAFAYWVRLDRSNVSMQQLRRLPPGELKFLVDNVAPFAELDWARRNVGPGLTDLGQAYSLVPYRKDRLEQNRSMWERADYRLATILHEGGICVDQAYFASEVGKAKGIPTILFRGAGLDGRHAWLGYLDGAKHWQLDCGRYAEQQLVVGVAFDPQTWSNLNDHELLFISERFRELPTYQLSLLHAGFAAEYLRDGRPGPAFRAAREAVNRDSRNLEGWQILLQAQAALHPGDPGARETLLREAILAFQKYPDLDIAFTKELADTLRARGEVSLAGFEESQLVKKYRKDRSDLGVQLAAEKLENSMHQDDLGAQIRVYDRLLAETGRGGGLDFYDRVVVPFVAHLRAVGKPQAALAALERARHTLRIEPGKQLDQEMAGLAGRIKAGKP